MTAKKATKIIPVVMCGGVGSRLWPLSRAEFPKQFLNLYGAEATLFQSTIERIIAVDDSIRDIIIITNEAHRFFVLDQLSRFPTIIPRLILEPVSRNTAPALTLAALEAQSLVADSKQGDNFVLCVMPSDQIMKNGQRFKDAISAALELFNADPSGDLISIFGIKPLSPHTGYGYIGLQDNSNLVNQFVEKPSFEIAKSYLDKGSFYWNSGIFMMHPDTWLNAMNEFRPDIYQAVYKTWVDREVDDIDGSAFIRPNAENFLLVPSESIDYSVMEKCRDSKFEVRMVELEAGWNDLGSWDSVWEVNPKDGNGNVVLGDALAVGVSNSFIKSSHRLVGAVGVNDLVVVETSDCVLVANRTECQDIKLLMKRLEADSRVERNLHRKVCRPWGWYDSLDEDLTFKVKKINVKPGESISLQKHLYRSEHWIVVKGVAEVINGESTLTLRENQGTYIPVGQIHRLRNPGSEPLEIIEVQSGSYLGEDDIVRFEDRYGRI